MVKISLAGKENIRMVKRRGNACMVILIGIAMMTSAGTVRGETEAPAALAAVQQKVAAEFGRLDSEMKTAAEALGTAGLKGEAARSVLNGLCGKFSYAVDCAAVDTQGKMVTVEPAPFRTFEGKDISGQEQVRSVMKSRRPVLSRVFNAVEGFAAIDLEYPVADAEGRFIGSLSLLFKPEQFLGDVIRPAVQGMPLDIWAMEKEGLILYDVDRQQIGLNLFTSRLYRPYAELIRLGRRISKMPEGSGDYWFLSGPDRKTVKKNAHWKSVALHGTEWRLVAIHVEQGSSGKDAGTADQNLALEQRLESFAARDFLLNALACDNKTRAMKYLKEFYDHTPGIYSVQWVNEKGINRFGYPVKNSLSDYNYTQNRTQGDAEILKILSERKQAVWEKTLLEGKRGVFTFTPAFKDKQYLGMVYVIRLK